MYCAYSYCNFRFHIIGESFCNSLVMLLCIAKEVHFEQIAFNKLFHTEVRIFSTVL